MFEVYNGQNWKIPKEILNTLSLSKNIDMIEFRIGRNLNQRDAAELAGIHPVLWMNLENKKSIPTESEASKIATLLGKNAFKLFPIRRHDTIRMIPIKRLSKLTLIRCCKGITQVELATQAEVTLSVVMKLEREWKKIEDVPEELRPKVQLIADLVGEDIINVIGEAI